MFEFPPTLPGGAYHGSDLRYWATFARTGDPSGPGLPCWVTFDTGAAMPHVQSLAPGRTRPVDLTDEHQLAFWEQLDRTP